METSLTISTKLTIVISADDATKFTGNPNIEQDILQGYINVARRYKHRRTDICMPDGRVVYTVNSHIK